MQKLIHGSIFLFIMSLMWGCGAGSDFGIVGAGFEGTDPNVIEAEAPVLEEAPLPSHGAESGEPGDTEITVITPTLNPGDLNASAVSPSEPGTHLDLSKIKSEFQGTETIEWQGSDVITANVETEEEPNELHASNVVSATAEPEGEPIELNASTTISVTADPKGETIDLENDTISVTYKPDTDRELPESEFQAPANDPERAELCYGDCLNS